MSSELSSPRHEQPLDDDLDQLAPFDEDDETVGTGEPGDELDAAPDDAADDALEDREAGDLVAADEVDFVPDDRPASPDEDPGADPDSDEIDLLDGSALAAGDAEAPGVGDEDFELDPEGDPLLGDAGEEGTVGETDLLGTGGELPELDGDEDEAEPAAHDIEPAPLPRRSPPLPPWQDATWTLHAVAGPALPLVAVACRGGRVFAGGAGLFVLGESDLTPARIDLPLAPGAAVVAVAIEPRPPFRLAVATSSGGLFLLAPGGALSTLAPPEGRDARPTHLAWTGDLLARFSSGQVQAYREPGARWEPRTCPPLVALVADEQGALTLGATLGREARLLLSRDAGASWAPRDSAAHDLSPSPSPRVAVTDGAMAIASNAGLLVSRRGEPFAAPEGCAGALALCFEGGGPDAPLLGVLQRDEGAQTYLVRVLAEGQAALVAELSGPGRELDDRGEPSIDGLAWDSSRSLLWIATSGGLVAAGPRRARG